MENLPDVIIYIWLLPLALYVVLPLSLLGVYLLVRLIHFMFFPRRPKVHKHTPDSALNEWEKIG